MSVPTNLIPTKITGLPEYTGSSQAGYFPYVLDGSTYKVQFSNVASSGEVPPSRTLTAGTGLVGGGDLSANRVFAIANGGVGASQLDTTGVVAGVYGNGSNVPTVTVDANGRVTSVTTSPVVATGYVPEGRLIIAGTGLLGGGSLANNITLSVNLATATPQALGTATAGVSTAAAREDHVHPAVDLSDTNETQGSLPLGRGGTGDALSPVAGAVVYSTGTKFALTNPGIPGQVLTSTGTDEPLWTTLTGTGTVTSVNASGGTTGMTFTGGPVTTIGTLTLGGTLSPDNGGTGLTATPTNGQLLIGNGAGYTLAALTAGTGVSVTNAAGSITVTNTAPDQIVSLTAGTAISVSGTYPNFTINNTAPDQIVSLTGAGTTSISGTYPNFTITSNDQFAGTVTSVAASGGTTGLTFSGSPITSAGTLTLGGTLAIGSGGTGASTAGAARTALGAAALGANTDITSIALTSGTILNAPTSGTDIVNKAYADSIASGINFHQAVRLATVAALPAYTYNNGTGGVGATITANANGALSIDGVAVVAGNRVLIKNEVGAAQADHGVYVVTQTGNGSTPFILTRATDFDSTGTGVDQIDAGDFFLVTAGATLANTSWVQQTPLPITIGTTPIIFSQFGAPVLYTAGTGLTLAGTVFSITNTGVTASTYGSASQVPVIAVNAQGQITSASSTSIAIAASQITSGVLPVGNGGTGATTFTSNGVLLGNGTSAVTTTAAGTTGQVLVGNTGLPPTWATLSSTAVTSFSAGTTGLTPSSPTTGAVTLDGVLKVSNGGTGVTTATGSGSAVLSNSPTLVTPTLGAASATSIANGLGAVGTPSYTFTGDLNTGMWSPAADTIAFSEGGVEAMRIDSSGNVGIGTATPSGRLTVYQDQAAYSYFDYYNTTNGGGVVWRQIVRNLANTGTTSVDIAKLINSGFAINNNDTNAANFTLFGVGGVERMRINSSGNVGIGTSTPSVRLDVIGDARVGAGGGTFQGLTLINSDDSAAAETVSFIDTRNNLGTADGDMFFGHQTDGGSYIRWDTTPPGARNTDRRTERMRITAAGNVGIGTSAPTSRLTITGGITEIRDGNYLMLRPSGNGWDMRLQATGTQLDILSGGALGSPIMSLVNGGNVGIGITNPGYPLAVQANSGSGAVRLVGRSADSVSTLEFTNSAQSLTQGFIQSNGNNLLFATSTSERMRIDSSGNVGIGTSSPATTLSVVIDTTAHNGMRVTNNSTTQFAGAGLQMLGPSAAGAQGGTAIYYYNTTVGGTQGGLGIAQLSNAGVFQRNLAYYDFNGQSWAFLTNSSERLVINSSGNVGIGTSSPGVRLDVAGGAIRVGNTHSMQFRNAAGTGVAVYTLQSDDNFVVYNAAGTPISSFTQGATNIAVYGSNASNRMQVDSINNVTSWIVNGSERARFNSSGEFLVGTSSGGRTVCINAADNWIRQSNPSRSWLIGNSIGTSYLIYDETAGETRFAIDTNGVWNGPNAIVLGQGKNLDNRIELGSGRTGNNFAYIDLIGDTVYTDYGLRLLRGNGGPNTFSQLYHRGTGSFEIGAVDAAAIVFLTSNAERMRITSGGEVYIAGTTDQGAFNLQVNGTGVWGAGAYVNGSDRSLKKEIAPLAEALDVVNALKPVTFRYKEDYSKDQSIQPGFIAQELQEALGGEVYVDGVVQAGPKHLNVAYQSLIPVLVKAIQELTARVAQLEGN